ncbi:hypothetical protein Ancab_025404, partial [Ancistrocladus abbreviatus]
RLSTAIYSHWHGLLIKSPHKLTTKSTLEEHQFTKSDGKEQPIYRNNLGEEINNGDRRYRQGK